MKPHDLGSDHAALRDALARAEGALLAMETGVAASDRSSRYTPRHLRPIRMAWNAFAEQLADHLDAEERMVHPAIRHLLGGRTQMASAVSTCVAQMFQAHEQLDELAHQLRLTLKYCPPLASPIERVIERFQAHAQREDTDHYATALQLADQGFCLDDTPIPMRHRTIADLDRALRTPKPHVARETTPTSKRPSWIKQLLSRRS
ncbi:MAG: hemerythrin domain-containing protein [Proteobacteria bacterium]|nr:hemerythrin domain-containing protein [Pseudomonadota bacterium]